MIEFDVPGHAAAWCTGYPEICPSASCKEPLDPSNEATFNLIDDLIAESTGRAPGLGLFPYNLLHLGGDEVDYKCWENDEDIQVAQKIILTAKFQGRIILFINSLKWLVVEDSSRNEQLGRYLRVLRRSCSIDRARPSTYPRAMGRSF
jgi:hypothetical protein